MDKKKLLIICFVLLVVLIGILILVSPFLLSLLFYIGVFNPSPPPVGNGAIIAVSNKALGLSVLGVDNFTVNGAGAITLYIVNNAQAPVNLTDIMINGTSLTNLNPSLPIVMNPGTSLTIRGDSTISGKKGAAFYNTIIEFYFTMIGGNAHNDIGYLDGKID
jgi:hypothetical protein